MATCNIGLIGAGTVGGGVIKIFNTQKSFYQNKLGLSLVFKRIADKNTGLFNDLPVGEAICSENADDILSDEEIQIVVELVGGTTFARELVLQSLSKGKHVVTANKALIAEHGHEIFETAEENNVSVFFEAAVGGGMPVIKTIRESLLGNDIISVRTIINGTCNYILTQMSERAAEFNDVLQEAQKNGYAEADPTLDIGGGDTGHKLAILASLLYGGYAPFEKIYIEGITHITAEDIALAKSLGYCIKLLGIIKQNPTAPSTIDVRVHPCMLHTEHILASVSDVFNAVSIQGDAVGHILLYGKGAGEMPTASSVMGDIIDIARNITEGSPRRIPMDFYSAAHELAITPMASITTRYFLRFSVVDKPKVLAAITTVLGNHGISLASVMQKERSTGEFVPVIMITHEANENNLQKAIAEIERQDFIRRKTRIIRIED